MGWPRWVGLRGLCNCVLDFVYPGRCASCDSGCRGEDFLCEQCLVQIAAIEAAPRCDCCAMPLAADGDPCPYCQGKGLTPLARIARLGTFRDPLRHLIHALKYRSQWAAGEFLAQRLAAHPSAAALLADADLIVPVPLHWKRRLARGYNQSSLVAARLARLARRPVVSAVRRIRDTPSQTQLHSHQKRADNVRGAFALRRPAAVAGKKILLVDDVMTTGQTLRAVARAIAPAGPAQVSALVIAVADPRGRDFKAI